MVRIVKQQDRSAAIESSGATTFTREIQFEGDTLMEIMSSHLLPQRGSRHPENTIFYLDSVQVTPNGNRERRVQAKATLNYSNASELVRYFSGDPWDLGAQNFASQYQTVPEPLLEGYNAEGKPIQMLNSAGCRILAETTKTIREINFTYNVRARSSGQLPTSDKAIINEKTETVAGITIPPRTGLLLPTTATFITEYDGANDVIRRQYWDIAATIQLKDSGWSKQVLNVGTMAFFKIDDIVVKRPCCIYKYTPWESQKDEENVQTRPKFGSIDNVIAAKSRYAKIASADTDPITGDQNPNKLDYQVAWNNLPFEEVTEPMPLNLDGTLDEDAIEYPDVFPYKKIEIYDSVIGSWNAFNLPKKRA